MSARLSRLQFKPRGESGWSTPRFVFGPHLTVFLGPNGSGKTPILKGLAFALGHPIELPAEVVSHCESVELEISDLGSVTTIERMIGTTFRALVRQPVPASSERQERVFSSEKEYSAFVFELLGITDKTLLDLGGRVVPGYMSVFAPLFWIDQDLGWRDLYAPLSTHKFIKDQSEEMIRWALAAPWKNRPVDKTAYADAKARLESVRQQVAIRRSTLETLIKDDAFDLRRHSLEALRNERARIEAEIRKHASALEMLGSSTDTLDRAITSAVKARDTEAFALESAEKRLQELQGLGGEIKDELDILETNELAADAFRTLCGSQSCQFFRNPEESYGRRVLYLRDQLKDFMSTTSGVTTELQQRRDALARAERRLNEAKLSKQRTVVGGRLSHVATALEHLSRELAGTDVRLAALQRIADEENRFASLIEFEAKLAQEVEASKPRRGEGADTVRITEVRSALQTALNRWLEILGTPNVSNVSVNNELRVCVGSAVFTENSAISGSTRTRIVLAFHAALMETSLQTNGNHPGFLILDTPRQHELHASDLQSYFAEFEKLSRSQDVPVQLIFAATDPNVLSPEMDITILEPTFPPEDDLHYFGPVAGSSDPNG